MAAQFYIKTFSNFTRYRLFIWPIVLIISFAGFWYPKMGLMILPMFAAIMIMGFFKGRFWCGNICPRGAFMDIPARKIGQYQKILRLFRNKYFRLFILVVLMSLFTRNTLKAINAWGTIQFLDKLGMAGVMMCAVTTFIGLILALTINPRSWCTFCPMGTIQKFLHKIRKKLIPRLSWNKKITMTQPSVCIKCGVCSRVCPMQLRVHDNALNEAFQVDDLDCIKCKTCVNHCKTGTLKYEKEILPEDYRIPKPSAGFEKRKVFEAIITRIEYPSSEVREITFKIRDKSSPVFIPGQFISIKVDEEHNIYRAYSISMPSQNSDELTISVKLDRKGYATPGIFNLKVGDKLFLEGPMGDFIIEKYNTNKLFIAGGIGITPFLSLVKEALEKDEGAHVNLYYGSNKVDDIIYSSYFHALKEKYPNFNYCEVLLRPHPNWQGHQGYVTDHIKNMNLENTEAYLCGPGKMIDATVKILKDKGLSEEEIHVDFF